ncbi:alpha/beta hydrolase [Ramlibacter sp. G-1-2-2]|uniref:Alpha/beta hydrolase n=1 Tax=Ramlibacter agri TaxID=2728837 RepID=A0A848HEJ1_9BURK|nr:alpha/beta hydrolase [Ramlibacter agri]NML46953.1 alpha/beta hydrolase [Ramlibacter agri]
MKAWIATLLLAACGMAAAQEQRAVDLPTRPGVTERIGVLAPAAPKAVVVLMSGGEGRIDVADDGRPRRAGNFLIRSRERFAAQGLAVLMLDTPSDRSNRPFLGGGFRESAEHAADMGAAIAWARDTYKLPVWMVGTSRGTESTAQAATRLTGAQAPDGIVLTSSILAQPRFANETGQPVTAMDLARIHMPVLVVHHEQDPCGACPPDELPALMAKFPAGLAELKTYSGGISQGPACEAFSHHGYNGIEDRVVADIAAWLLAHH